MIRVGVIGVGYWGPNLVRTLNEMNDATVIRVADMDSARRDFIQRRFPGVETTASADDVIDDRSVDAVFIATPPPTHYSLAKQSLNAGKHVFVEKPLAIDLAQAEEIVDLARLKERKLAVGHLFLYHPAITAIQNGLLHGEFGDLLFMCCSRFNPGPPKTKVDVLWDLAPHDVSIVLHLAGESPTRITAEGGRFMNREFIETAFINLEFPSGRIAQINVGWLTPVKTRTLMCVCGAKTVVYDDMQTLEKLRIYGAARDNRLNDKDHSGLLAYAPGSIVIPPLSSSQPLRLECEDFLASITTGNEPVSNGARAIEVVRVLELASRSIYSRLPAEVRA